MEAPDLADTALQERRPVADDGLQLLPAASDEEGADIVFTLACTATVFVGGKLDGRPGHLDLGLLRAAGQLLHAVAVAVSGTEIELLVVRPFAEDPVDMRHVLEPDAPFRVVDLAQALDDIAHGHVAGGKAVVLRHHDLFGIRAGLLQPLVQPGHRKAGCLGGIAKPVEELCREGVVRREGFHVLQDAGACIFVVQPDDPVRQFVCPDPHASRLVHPHGDPAQVLDQHEAEDGRQRPQFPDLKRLGLLEPLDERRQRFLGDGAVGMGDIEPGQRHHPRHGVAADRHPGKLAIEPARKIAPDLLDGLLDDIVIVDQPLGGRGNGRARIDVGGDRPVNPKDVLFVRAVAPVELEGRELGKAL